MADRYGGRDSEDYGGRDYGRYGGREEGEDERRERYRQGLDYRGPYDVTSRRGRGGYGPRGEYEGEMRGGRDYGSDYGRGYGRGYESDYGREYGRDYVRGFGRDYGRDYARGDEDAGRMRYGRERYYGGSAGARGYDYGRGYESDYGRDYERRGYARGYDYEDEDEREYRREEERGRGTQTDYGRTSSRFFGRGGGEYEGRYARGYDYEEPDERGGERVYDYDEGERGGGRSRGWLDRVSDEVASWFGDREAVRRRRLDEKRARRRGRGPKNYRRSDERIREDINDRLSDQDYLDASDIEVTVSGGEVTLSGRVETRYDKRLAEDIAESVFGVTQVQNNLRVEYRGVGATHTDETTVVAPRPAATGGPTDDVTMTSTAPGVTNDARAAETTLNSSVGAAGDTTSDAGDIGGASSNAASGGR